MATNRRQFLQFGMGLVLANAVPVQAKTGAVNLLSCRTTANGQHFLSRVDLAGHLQMDIPLPARGHSVAISHNQQIAAVFSRRPGYFVWLVNLAERRVVHKITPSAGRHFYGHGVFTADGTRLLCTENAYDSGEGVIGVYNAKTGYSHCGELASFGIGPHEIKLLNDDRTLVIANGGIRTHPDLPRIKANLDTMQPNLAYIDRVSGRLLHRHKPESPWHQLSIRHIDVAPDNTVAVAMQFQGRPYQQPPLIAIQKGEQPLTMLSAPAEVQNQLRNYCGSVTFSADGSRFAVSAPRGGIVTYWTRSGAYLGVHQQPDACGLAAHPQQPQGFISSDGNGQLHLENLSGSSWSLTPQTRWDNHMLAIRS